MRKDWRTTVVWVLIVVCTAAVADEDTERIDDPMSTDQFGPAIELLRQSAPDGWRRIRFFYRHYELASDVAAFVAYDDSDDWEPLSVSNWDIMDFFDNHRESVHPTLNSRWSILELTFNSGDEVNVRYGYGDPKMLDRVGVDPGMLDQEAQTD